MSYSEVLIFICLVSLGILFETLWMLCVSFALSDSQVVFHCMAVSQLILLVTKYRNNRTWGLKPGRDIHAATACWRSFPGTKEAPALSTEMIDFPWTVCLFSE